MAEHRVEAGVRHGEGLAVLEREGHRFRRAEAGAGLLQHRWRHVGGGHAAGRPDDLRRGFGGHAGPGRDVEYPLPGGASRRPQQERDEPARDVPEHAVAPVGGGGVEECAARGL